MRYRRFYTGQIIERFDRAYRYKVCKFDFISKYIGVICLETNQRFIVSFDSLITNSSGRIFLENFL